MSRAKHDGRYPARAIRHVLGVAGLMPADLGRVVFYESPWSKFERVVRGVGERERSATVSRWLLQGRLEVADRIGEDLGIDPARIGFCGHHQSHAAAAFFCSPFETATVVVLDGVGEKETASAWRGSGGSLRRIWSVRFPHSIGLLYSIFTAFLGFEVNDGEHKLMGMAAYGAPSRVADIERTLARRRPLRLSRRFYDFTVAGFVRPAFGELFGAGRVGGDDFAACTDPSSPETGFADVAASIQAVTENLVGDFVAEAVSRTGIPRVAMAGGVALNGLANARLQRDLGVELFVQPAAGDAGSAMGAALWEHCVRRRRARPPPLETPLIGGAYDDDRIRRALDDGGFACWRRITEPEALIGAAADLLAAGRVIGWFQGRSEWGPRALGARSLLAPPAPAGVRDLVNRRIKFREAFRPFAPAVLAERAADYFEIAPPMKRSQPESFMLSIARVRQERREELAAVTHVDGTARLQLVWPDPASAFRQLIEAFAARTGTPVLLNTSFNLRGEPIVETPEDALQTFSWSGLETLVMGSFVIEKGPIR